MPLSFLGCMTVSLHRTLTRPFKTIQKSKRIQSLRPSEKKKTCRNLGSVYSLLWFLVFGFLEKHQKKKIVMETSDQPSVGQFDRESLGAGTPVRPSQNDAGSLSLGSLMACTHQYPANRKPQLPFFIFPSSGTPANQSSMVGSLQLAEGLFINLQITNLHLAQI